jgi:hypothetical protein
MASSSAAASGRRAPTGALARAGQRMPGLELFGNRLVQQGSLGVARVVELGFGADTRVRARLGLRASSARCSGGGGGHGTVPARARCLMILGLYPATQSSTPRMLCSAGTSRLVPPNLSLSPCKPTLDAALAIQLSRSQGLHGADQSAAGVVQQHVDVAWPWRAKTRR